MDTWLAITHFNNLRPDIFLIYRMNISRTHMKEWLLICICISQHFLETSPLDNNNICFREKEKREIKNAKQTIRAMTASLYIYIYMCKLFVLHTNKLVGLESVFFYTLIWKTRCRLALKNEEHEERLLSTSAKHAQVCELYDGKRRCAYPFPCHHRQCRRKGGAELILTIIALCTKKKKRLASH